MHLISECGDYVCLRPSLFLLMINYLYRLSREKYFVSIAMRIIRIYTKIILMRPYHEDRARVTRRKIIIGKRLKTRRFYEM